MSFTHRPAKRENTPLIIGLAGPTKSGKTYSAHRVAAGLANGGHVVMINAEGAKGHQYADEFSYSAVDITRPFRPERYTEALRYALGIDPKPAAIIIDSMTHMHQGPGGYLEYQQDELDRLAGKEASQKERDKRNPSSWIKPQQAVNQFVYTLLEAHCHLVLCFRAKEKIDWSSGKPKDLGWQPIAGDTISFETLFTLMLPPHSKGAPDLSISDMRKPFDKLIPSGRQLDENVGRRLAEWAAGGLGESETDSSGGSAARQPSAGDPQAAVAGGSSDSPNPLDLLIATYGRDAVWGAYKAVFPDKEYAPPTKGEAEKLREHLAGAGVGA